MFGNIGLGFFVLRADFVLYWKLVKFNNGICYLHWSKYWSILQQYYAVQEFIFRISWKMLLFYFSIYSWLCVHVPLRLGTILEIREKHIWKAVSIKTLLSEPLNHWCQPITNMRSHLVEAKYISCWVLLQHSLNITFKFVGITYHIMPKECPGGANEDLEVVALWSSHVDHNDSDWVGKILPPISAWYQPCEMLA